MSIDKKALRALKRRVDDLEEYSSKLDWAEKELHRAQEDVACATNRLVSFIDQYNSGIKLGEAALIEDEFCLNGSLINITRNEDEEETVRDVSIRLIQRLDLTTGEGE